MIILSGENLSQRTIMAETDVAVLRIPNFILQQHNTANIWTRIQNFQNTRIPSLEELFKKFLEDRQWEKYCTSFVGNLKSNKAQNPTTTHDVPVSLRAKFMHCDDENLKALRNKNAWFRNSLESYYERRKKSSLVGTSINLG